MSSEDIKDIKLSRGFLECDGLYVYVYEPKCNSQDIIESKQLVNYLGVGYNIKLFSYIMRDFLKFANKKVLKIPNVDKLLELKSVSERDMGYVLNMLLMDREPDDLDLLFSLYFDGYEDYVYALGHLGWLLHNDRVNTTELTYDDHLPYIMAFMNYNHRRDKDVFNLPDDDLISDMKDIILRIQNYHDMYIHDNAIIPFGDGFSLRTNLARFDLSMRYTISDSYNDDILAYHHRDLDRDTHRKMGAVVGDYSVIYNPLFNKMFVWDYSDEYKESLSL